MGKKLKIFPMSNGDDGQEKKFPLVDVYSMSAQQRLSYSHMVKSVREELGMTQDELAEAAGTTRRTIGNFERGSNAPQPRILASILRALGINQAGEGLSADTMQYLSILGNLIEAIDPDARELAVRGAMRVFTNAVMGTRLQAVSDPDYSNMTEDEAKNYGLAAHKGEMHIAFDDLPNES